MEQREEVGVGERLEDRLQDQLSTPHARQPVMDDGDTSEA